MPEYEVEVTRTVSETRRFRVTASSLQQALDNAAAEAGNTDFNNPGTPEYEIGPARKIGPV